jgi:hypothetical protein
MPGRVRRAFGLLGVAEIPDVLSHDPAVCGDSSLSGALRPKIRLISRGMMIFGRSRRDSRR